MKREITFTHYIQLDSLTRTRTAPPFEIWRVRIIESNYRENLTEKTFVITSKICYGCYGWRVRVIESLLYLYLNIPFHPIIGEVNFTGIKESSFWLCFITFFKIVFPTQHATSELKV